MTDQNPAEGRETTVMLEANVTVSAERAIVDVHLRNRGKEALVVFDRPTNSSALRVPAPIGEHISHLEIEDDGTLILGMIVAYPGTKTVEQMTPPCVTRVEPGATLRRTLTLPLPLAEFNTYYAVLPESATQLVTSRAVEIWASYLWTGNGKALVVRDEKLGCDKVDPLPYDLVENATVRLADVRLPVRRRSDRFHQPVR